MLHFGPRTHLLCAGSALSRHRGFASALKSSPDSSSAPAYGNAAVRGSGVIGGRIDVSYRNNIESFCSSFMWMCFSSRWNGDITASAQSPSSTGVQTNSGTKRRAARESAFFLRSALLHASGSVAGFTTTAAPATGHNALCSETEYSFGKVYHQPLEVAALPLARTSTASSCRGRNKIKREAITAAVGSNVVVKVGSAVTRIARLPATLVLKEEELIPAETAQGSPICAANTPAATLVEQRTGWRSATDITVARASGEKRTLRTSRNVTAAALQSVTSIGGIQTCGACAVYQLKCNVAPGSVQALATRCYIQQRVDRVTATAADTAASQRERGTAKARRSYKVDDRSLVGTLQLSTEQAKRSQKVATTCDCGFLCTRYKCSAAAGGRGGKEYPCIFFKNRCLVSVEDRVKRLSFLSLPRSQESGRWCASTTAAQKAGSRPGATASQPKHEGDQQQENGRDRAQEQFVFQPPPRGQALLGLLAAVGACLSLVLLYERSLLDSAALLYGAWDTEWDASWRASSEQYEAELTAKGAQTLPCVAGEPASGGTEMPTASLRPPTRQIILVRHGQYRLAGTDEERGLTDLGAKQAAAAGRRLRELLQGQHVQAIVHSNMKRARETASIIQEVGGFKAVPLVEDALLAEGAPAEPIPPSDTFWPSPTDIALDSPRIERAFRRYFYRARTQPTAVTSPCRAASDKLFPVYQANTDSLSASAKGTAAANTGADVQSPQQVLPKDSFIIIVCHGNVIRYFLMRALQLPPCAWLRWALFNTGLTWMSIDAKGRVSCRNFGDVGHLPAHMISYN